MQVRTIQSPGQGTQTFRTRAANNSRRGLSGLGEVVNGWNVLPSEQSPERLVPTTAATRKLGQDFSAALNAALNKEGVPGQAQTDGVISLFHVELLGDLLLMPGMESRFPVLSEDAIELSTDRETQMFILSEMLQEDDDLRSITNRLNQVAGVSSSGGKKSLVVPLAVGGGLILFLLATRTR